MKKVLSREVGEAHVEDALNVKKGDNAWRGRAEMIENQKYHHQLQHYHLLNLIFRKTIEVLQELIKEQKPSSDGDNVAVVDESETVQMKKLSREFRSLNQAAEVERQRLSELVTLLTARLSLAEERTSEAEAGLREERQRCARAELALERVQVDLRDSGKLNSSVGSRGSSVSEYRQEYQQTISSLILYVDRRLVEADVEKMSEEEVRWEVIRLKEEVRAVRRELGEARGAREEMVRIYKQMLEDTRHIYRQNLTE